jgi:ATP-dependent RNA helicase DeaD
VEHEQDAAITGVSRGQNQLHVLPEDSTVAHAVLEPFLDRIDGSTAGGGPQLLVITNDGEAAAGIASKLTLASKRGGDLRVLAATDARRAARVQRTASAHVVLGPPLVLVELLQAAVLKTDSMRAVVLAWVEELDEKSIQALEAVMAEVPKDAARAVIASATTPAVEQLVERYARRARKMQPVGTDPQAPVSLSYVTVIESGRLSMLRRLLDATDPESATIVVRTPDSRTAVLGMLRSLGYGDESAIRVADSPDEKAELVIVYDLPSSDDDVRRLVRSAGSARVLALVAPRQLSALRRLAGGAISPFALPAAAERARSREDRLRDELRAILATGQYSRELLALEPLLAEFDGAEIAAAALRLLEGERTRAQTPAADAAAPAMTRLYVNVGEMDNVRAGDLVGAVTNEVGISKSELGRVEVRERHSTIEVATPVANAVVAKLTGVSIKGRRVLAKIDEGATRGGREHSGRDRPGRDRPGRDRPGGDRPGRDRRERPARPRPPRQ